MARRVASLAVVLLLISFAAPALAQDAPEDRRFGMTVAPVRVFTDGAPGERSETFRVLNDGEAPIDVFATVSGTDASWVQLAPAEFQVAPGMVQEVRATLRVPEGAPPGDHNLSVTFTAKGKQPGTVTQINRAIGAQLIVSVPGEAHRKISFGDLSAPSLADSSPLTIALEVRNEGNVHRDFRGKDALEVRTQGRAVAALPETTLLAGENDRLETTWENPPLFCICTLRVAADDGSGQTVTATKRVIVFPFRLAVGTLLLAFGLRLLWRARRRRLDALLAAARAQGREEALGKT